MSTGKKSVAGSKGKSKPKVEVDLEVDVVSYSSLYSGAALLERLSFLSQVLKENKEGVLVQLVEEVKQTENARAYREIMSSHPELKLDGAWATAKEKEAKDVREALEASLTAAKGNMVKEDIRVAHLALGDFYYARGDLTSALKCYIRMRDYCGSPEHIVEMSSKVAVAALGLKNWSHVHNYVSKAEQTSNVLPGTSEQSRFRIASGIAYLATHKHKAAARSFLEVSAELAPTYSDLVAVRDLARYAGLCGLASFSRREVFALLVENPAFQSLLDLSPEVGSLIDSFYNSRYTQCLQLLEELRPHVLADVYLSDHVQTLYKKIRSKALVQYFSPFSSVKLQDMSAAFNGISIEDLEQELRQLINEDAIQARIDSYNKVLYAKQVDQRTATFNRALQAGKEYQENTKEMLLRMDVMRKELQVRGSRGGGGGGGGGGGRKAKKRG